MPVRSRVSVSSSPDSAHLNRGRKIVGEIFDPNRDICGFYPPDIVSRQQNLTDGQKRLYERAARWAGRNAQFWYGFEKIASELGKSTRQVKRDMAALEQHGLIRHTRRGKRQSNIYQFVYHPMFESEVTSASHRSRGEVTDLSSEVTSTSLGEGTPASHESCNENCEKESSSDRKKSPTSGEVLVELQSGDDASSLKNKTLSPELLAVLSGVSLSFGNTDPLMGVGPLPRALLEAAAQSIHVSRCNTGFGGVDLNLFPPPDIGITTAIVECWRGKGVMAFADWISRSVCRVHIGLRRSVILATARTASPA